MGKLESIDVKLFCAAAMDFYRTQVRHFPLAESCLFIRFWIVFIASFAKRFQSIFLE